MKNERCSRTACLEVPLRLSDDICPLGCGGGAHSHSALTVSSVLKNGFGEPLLLPPFLPSCRCPRWRSSCCISKKLLSFQTGFHTGGRLPRHWGSWRSHGGPGTVVTKGRSLHWGARGMKGVSGPTKVHLCPCCTELSRMAVQLPTLCSHRKPIGRTLQLARGSYKTARPAASVDKEALGGPVGRSSSVVCSAGMWHRDPLCSDVLCRHGTPQEC